MPRTSGVQDEGWRAASPRKKRIALGAGLTATLISSALAYFQGNSYMLAPGLIGSAVFAGLLLAVRDE